MITKQRKAGWGGGGGHPRTFSKSTSADSEYSELESENRFGENEDNELDNLDELFKGIELEPYQLGHIKKNYERLQKGSSQNKKENMFLINHWEKIWTGKIEWCTCTNCRAESQEIDCLCWREVNYNIK